MEKCWCGNKKLIDYSENYFLCKKCHTLISKHKFEEKIYNVKNETDDLYGKNYWEKSMKEATGLSSLNEIIDAYISDRVVYWLKYILKYMKLKSNIAEVGCGLGQLQYVLKRMEYTQIAYELSEDICNYISKTLEIDVCCGSFTPEKEKYDGILTFDLIEHLIQPDLFLKNCAKSLKLNGLICIQTPCYDSSLSYEEMLKNKPRFEEQLKAEQHIFLYSRESITDLLKKNGLTNIIFEPAYFGDDYDMFLFASKNPINKNSDKEIDDFLNKIKIGRLIKAMITLFDEKQKMFSLYQIADRDRTVRLAKIDELEHRLQVSDEDRNARLQEIVQLTAMLKENENEREIMKKRIETLTALKSNKH